MKIEKGGVRINFELITLEGRFDGKWVLQTNTNLSAEEVELKYKQIWEVEHVFRDINDFPA